MSNFVNTIDTLGDEATLIAIVSKTITEFNDDILTKVGAYAFYRCSSLKTVSLPNVTSADEMCFSYCSALSSAHLPKVSRVPSNCFTACNKLVTVDISNATSIGNQAFASCPALNVIILQGETVCTLSSTYAFTNTPFAAGKAGGTVYVPQALITEYQNATNWSTLYAAGTCNFVAIEGSEYE